MRLDQFISTALTISRKDARLLIQHEEITVNGQTQTIAYLEIDPIKDRIEHLLSPLIGQPPKYFMFHKPSGCITARKDAHQKTVMDYLSQEDSGVFPVGRLDKDTQGLLLLTNDGEWNHRVMHPDMHMEKTYYFHCFGTLDEHKILQLQKGVFIHDTQLACAKQITIESQGTYSVLKQTIILSTSNRLNKIPEFQQVVIGTITITEGRKHQVKRMLKAVGCFVIYLKRLSIGSLALDPNLQPGEYRPLTKEEANLF